METQPRNPQHSYPQLSRGDTEKSRNEPQARLVSTNSRKLLESKPELVNPQSTPFILLSVLSQCWEKSKGD